MEKPCLHRESLSVSDLELKAAEEKVRWKAHIMACEYNERGYPSRQMKMEYILGDIKCFTKRSQKE